ncbi:MAG: hypothetical protein Q4D87_04730 [Actinomycetaceae bacterium]|nr:hypothetical protein [Actinomycetaceae bacterium]
MRRVIVLYGNVSDYMYHFKEKLSEELVREILPDMVFDVDPSIYPEYVDQIYVFGYHNIDDTLEKLRAAGLDPVPERVADEPWSHDPEKETYEEYRVRIGIAK